MKYCPYCASGLWFDTKGQARCPSGVSFSLHVTSPLCEYVRTSSKPREDVSTDRGAASWYCPACGSQMDDDSDVSCQNCGRRLKALIRELLELNPHQAWPPKMIGSRSHLRSYWITFHDNRTFPQVGVTGHSILDAFTILNNAGHRASLHDTPAVVENVRMQDLDPNHVVPNIGPMIFRGVWYPRWQIGEGTKPFA